MEKEKEEKKGSSSPLIIFLIIALIAALIYIFYSDFLPKSPDTARRVTLDSARLQTGRYIRLLDTARVVNTGRINSFYYSAEFFTKENIEAILSQSGCDGIRIYHAINRNGRSTLIIVGVKRNESQTSGKAGILEDMLPDTANRVAAAVYNPSYYIVDAEDENLRCKDNCDTEGLGNPPQ